MQAIGVIYIVVAVLSFAGLAVAGGAVTDGENKIAAALFFPILLIQSVYLPAMFYYNIWATLN